MTLKQIRDLTYALLTQEENNSNWTNAQVDSFINRAYTTILRDIPTYLVAKTITTPDQQIYDTSDILGASGYSIVDIHSITYKDSSGYSKVLHRIPYDDILEKNETASNTQDSVVFFGFIDRTNNALALSPIPNGSTGSSLTIEQFMAPDSDIMTDDSDTPVKGSMPAFFHHIIAYQAAYGLFLASGEVERAMPFYETFLRPELANLVQWRNNTYKEPIIRFGKFI